MKKLLISLFIISFAIADDHIKMVEGTFVANNGEVRLITKIKGNEYNELVTYFDRDGNITGKHDIKFTLEPVGVSNYFLAVFGEFRSYTGKNFSKKDKWGKSPDWGEGMVQLLKFDKNHLMMVDTFGEGKVIRKYRRFVDGQAVWNEREKLLPLEMMEGSWVGKAPGGDANININFSINDAGTILTSEWTSTVGNWNTTVLSYNSSEDKIMGKIFTSIGQQIDLVLISSIDNIYTFSENSKEEDGGKYSCVTIFDFSEKGKLKWSATNRVSDFGQNLSDFSTELVKK